MIKGYPSSFTEEQLKELIGPDTIKKVKFSYSVAEVTFVSVKMAKQALIIDGVKISGNKLSVRPLDDGKSREQVKVKPPSTEANNLYVQHLPKDQSEVQVRRAFARFGRISSFRLVSKEQFSTNIAFVGFSNPDHAKAAFDRIAFEEEETLGPKLTLCWHKPKADAKNQLMK